MFFYFILVPFFIFPLREPLEFKDAAAYFKVKVKRPRVTTEASCHKLGGSFRRPFGGYEGSFANMSELFMFLVFKS